MKRRMLVIAGVAVAVLALVFPVLGLKAYYVHVAVMSLIYVLLASGLNVLTGYAGQLSLAHAGFFGIGAYASALLSLKLGWNTWLGLLAGGVLAGAAGVLLGVPALRLKGPYLVIASLGFGEIIRHVLVNWVGLTRGPMGLTGVPRMSPIYLPGLGSISFESKAAYYYLLLPIVCLTLVIIRNLVNSRTGRALVAIREDQVAAEVMGINLAFYKVLAFTFGAVLAGVAGSLYAHYIGFVSPDSFTVGESIYILMMVAVGGMGTLVGPVVGAVGLTYLLETMRILADYRLILYGVLLFLVAVFFPGGLAGELNKRLARPPEGG
ncbi:MAG: branched-chain amino acid ABC transporter permease [Bacillota bacterium]|nr:branched-chain amino acid ABC transporter permease [Bacillota bacterium]